MSLFQKYYFSYFEAIIFNEIYIHIFTDLHTYTHVYEKSWFLVNVSILNIEERHF